MNTFYLGNHHTSRTPSLEVYTGRDVLATVSFGRGQSGEQWFYIDNLWVSPDSFLEFDIREMGYSGGAFVMTRYDYSSIMHRIGFLDSELGRRGARSEHWHAGWYRIYVDKVREWTPPMVPEPSTYGAVLLGLGLGVVVLKRRRVKKGRRGSVLGSVPVSNVSAR